MQNSETMAKRSCTLKEAIDYCLDTDGSDIDSCCGGLSSDEEELLDNEQLLSDQEFHDDETVFRYV